MANFPTHIAVGTLVSGSLATLALAADAIEPRNVLAIAMAGAVGSVLPDIDLKASRPSQAMFNGLGLVISFALMFFFVAKLSIAELWILWIVCFVSIRFVAYYIFHRMSYHRGIYHSILAGVFFWFVSAIVFRYGLQMHEGVAWLAGGFTFVGYLTHLLLDEIYSVDVSGARVKRSFGTALKLYDRRKPWDSGAMAAATVVAFMFTPSSSVFVEGITSYDMWSAIHRKLLPEDKWFGYFGQADIAGWNPGRRIQMERESSLTTGSITVRPRRNGDNDGLKFE